MIQQKQCVETLGDPLVVKQHYWNTGILEQKKTTSWAPINRETDITSSDPAI